MKLSRLNHTLTNAQRGMEIKEAHSMRTWGTGEMVILYMQTVCNHARLHRVYRFSLDILLACVHGRKMQEKGSSSLRNATEWSSEWLLRGKQVTTHATWTQPSTYQPSCGW